MKKLLLLIFLVALGACNAMTRKPKEGELWLQCIGGVDDPFKKNDCDTIKILEVKDGFVRYRYTDSYEEYSQSIDMFVHHRKFLSSY